MKDLTSDNGFVVLYIMTREWASTIISSLITKGFIVSAGFDSEDDPKGKMYSADEDKISHVVCLRIKRSKSFTRAELSESVEDILKNNNISIFGGIVALNGNFNIMDSTIEKTKIEHPYR